MKKVTTLFSAMVLILIGFSTVQAQEALFFSEYIEGSSNNKAIELYNATDDTVSLANYQIAQSSNGNGWQFYHTFPAGAEILPKGTWVIVTDQTSSALYDTSKANEVLSFPSVTHHNGDDARALIYIADDDTTFLDVIGIPDSDPGTGWAVAGINNATAEHTLVRKSSVTTGTTDWAASAGTDADDSQWIVREQNYFTSLGFRNEVTDVTFIVNTSTLPDTLSENHYIQLRGAVNGNGGEYLGQMIDWNTDSDLVAENIGGDYWTVNVKMEPEDTLIFKVWSGFDAATGTNNGDGGWEVISANREFVSTINDTTALIYSDSETPPFTSDVDSVSLYFRVNMAAFIQDQSFNPETDKVGLRGNPQVFKNPDDWGSAFYFLEQEGDTPFYSGTVKVDNEAADTLGSVPYKFVAETASGVIWDNKPGNTDGNRFLDIPAADSTIHWVYMPDRKSVV